MKPQHRLSPVPLEHPSLSCVIDTAEAAMSICLARPDPETYGELASFALPIVDVDMRRQVAEALTAVIAQAEATRRNALKLPAGTAEVIASSEHIIVCAKRIWRLVDDQQGPDQYHR